MTPSPIDSEIDAVLETALKKAIAYGFDKGYLNDHKPDHEKANAIRDEAKAALLRLIAKENARAVEQFLDFMDTIYTEYEDYTGELSVRDFGHMKLAALQKPRSDCNREPCSCEHAQESSPE